MPVLKLSGTQPAPAATVIGTSAASGLVLDPESAASAQLKRRRARRRTAEAERLKRRAAEQAGRAQGAKQVAAAAAVPAAPAMWNGTAPPPQVRKAPGCL